MKEQSMAWTPEVKKIIETAELIATNRKDNYVRMCHIYQALSENAMVAKFGKEGIETAYFAVIESEKKLLLAEDNLTTARSRWKRLVSEAEKKRHLSRSEEANMAKTFQKTKAPPAINQRNRS